MSVFSFMPWYFFPMMLAGIVLPLLFLVKFLRGSAERKRILAHGVPAQATITRIWETGVRINNQPQVGFDLQVQQPGAAPYAAQTQMVVSALAIPRIQPGAVVRAKVDPADPSKVALEI